MGAAETCQWTGSLLLNAGSNATISCRDYAHDYRQCARGCKKVIAYCLKHGGDARAVEEMVEHHKLHTDWSG